MAGCYGSHPFDQYWERELDKYLETQEDEEVEEKNNDGREFIDQKFQVKCFDTLEGWGFDNLISTQDQRVQDTEEEEQDEE